MAPRTFLDLPNEILIRILDYLHIRPLLTLSLASRRCHDLSCQSLSSLAFGVYRSRVAKRVGRMSSRTVDLGDYPHFDPSVPHPDLPDFTIDEEDSAAVVIPQADTLEPRIQKTFHNALLNTTLSRYASGLRVLELHMWALYPSVAATLQRLGGLVSLNLTIRDPRTDLKPLCSRSEFHPGLCERDQLQIWREHGLNTAWKNLLSLRVEGVGLEELEDIPRLLNSNPHLKELVLDQRHNDGNRIRRFLQEWKGDSQLEEAELGKGWTDEWDAEMEAKANAFKEAIAGLKVRLYFTIEVPFGLQRTTY